MVTEPFFGTRPIVTSMVLPVESSSIDSAPPASVTAGGSASVRYAAFRASTTRTSKASVVPVLVYVTW